MNRWIYKRSGSIDNYCVDLPNNEVSWWSYKISRIVKRAYTGNTHGSTVKADLTKEVPLEFLK